VLLLGFTAWALSQRQRLDPALAAWNRLSRMLAHRGLARRAWDGPHDYAERVAAALSAEPAPLAAEVQSIAGIYARLRYAEASPAHAARLLRELQARIARFKRLGRLK